MLATLMRTAAPLVGRSFGTSAVKMSPVLFTKSHEWVDVSGSTATVGITSHAQSKLGDITFVELPKLNKTVASGDSLAYIESVKATADVYAPFPGTVIETNDQLTESPNLLNSDPESAGWIAKLKIDKVDLSALLDEAAYKKLVEEDDH